MIYVHYGLPVSYCTLKCQDEVSLFCLLKDVDFIHDNYTCISM